MRNASFSDNEKLGRYWQRWNKWSVQSRIFAENGFGHASRDRRISRAKISRTVRTTFAVYYYVPKLLPPIVQIVQVRSGSIITRYAGVCTRSTPVRTVIAGDIVAYRTNAVRRPTWAHHTRLSWRTFRTIGGADICRSLARVYRRKRRYPWRWIGERVPSYECAYRKPRKPVKPLRHIICSRTYWMSYIYKVSNVPRAVCVAVSVKLLIHAGFSKGSAYYVNRKFEKIEQIHACMRNKKYIFEK